MTTGVEVAITVVTVVVLPFWIVPVVVMPVPLPPKVSTPLPCSGIEMLSPPAPVVVVVDVIELDALEADAAYC